jgi:hypothetical protein
MFTPAHILCNWREQRPSNKGDLGSSVTREVAKVCCTGWTCFRSNLYSVVRDCYWVASKWHFVFDTSITVGKLTEKCSG